MKPCLSMQEVAECFEMLEQGVTMKELAQYHGIRRDILKRTLDEAKELGYGLWTPRIGSCGDCEGQGTKVVSHRDLAFLPTRETCRTCGGAGVGFHSAMGGSLTDSAYRGALLDHHYLRDLHRAIGIVLGAGR